MATILTKKSDTSSSVPLAADLTNAAGGAELAVNTADKRLYSKTSGGSVVELGTNPSALSLPNGTANGVPYLNGSKVLTTGSALTFDGTNLNVGIGGVGKVQISTASSGTFQTALYASNGVDTDFQVRFKTGVSEFGTSTATPLGFSIGGSEQMRLTSTGLGIGTSSPASKLDVIQSTSDTANGLTLRGYTTGTDGGRTFNINTVSSDLNNWANLNFKAQQFTFSIQGTEKMRLDSSGNLGLGVTPSAWLGSYKALQFTGGSVQGGTAGLIELYANSFRDTNGNFIYTTSGGTGRYAVSDAHRWYTAPSGTAGNAISFTQAMTLDASGNLGVGITNPNFVGGYTNFVVSNASNGGIVYVDRVGGARGYFYANGTTSVTLGNTSSIPLIFETNNTERARIDSSGNLLVGTTSLLSTSRGAFHAAVNGNAAEFKVATNGYGLVFFSAASAFVGSIAINSASVSYNTSSDYRLKENIAPMTGALAKVAALKPVTYTWKADGSDGEGFIAHELAEVCPAAVTGEKDAVDKDGKPQYQGIDVSFLVGTLTAAIQEQQALITALTARVAALESK